MNFSIKPGLRLDVPVTSWLESESGRRLAYSHYPAKTPWLELVISHGYSEHRGWWVHAAEAFAQAGVSVHLYDQMHHGASDGAPGDLFDFSELTGSLLLALRKGVAPRRQKRLPLVLMGHSNGGLITLRALNELAPDEIDGLVLCSPLLRMPLLTRLWGVPAAAVLRQINPAMLVPTLRDPSKMHHNEELWPQYQTDRFRFNSITPRFFREMHQTSAKARLERSIGQLPLLLLTAGRDQVVDAKAALGWFQRLVCPEKRSLHYPEMGHEIFNEVHWDQPFLNVLHWLQDHWGGPARPMGQPEEAPPAKGAAQAHPAKGAAQAKAAPKPVAVKAKPAGKKAAAGKAKPSKKPAASKPKAAAKPKKG